MEKEAKAVISSTMSLYGLGLALTLGLLAPASALAVRYFLTKYQAGIGLYILLPASAVTTGPVMLLTPFFLARNEERLLILYQIIGLVTNIVLAGLVVAFRGGLVGIVMASICGFLLTAVLLIVRFEGSVIDTIKNFKRYALLAAAGLGVGGIYTYWAVTSAGAPNHMNIPGLIKAAALYELAMLAVIFVTRRNWLEALNVIRAHPTLNSKETGVALSEIELSE